jgi:hypothetical protein
MSAQIEGLLFFLVMGILFLMTILFTIIIMKNTKNLVKSIIFSIGLSLLFFAAASLWWFNHASDGFSQAFGVLFYMLAFVVNGLVNTVIVFLIRKRAS